ncbi:MAG: TraB/GumN family protein [Kofleriaceae bacterium]|nr:TraB/GumN family protein [Kofleriaceae bacterium]
MKLRYASLLVALLAASAACKKTEEKAPPKVTEVGSAKGSAGSGSAGSAAAAADPWSKPEPAKDPLKHPLFWSIEKDGKTSYLLGTMHTGVDPQSRLPDIVWKKLDESKIFAMETDLGGAAKLDVLLKNGQSLKDLLGDEYWKKLEDAIGVQEANRLIGFKPMIPATLISMRGLQQTPPMDGVLHGRALNQNKKIVFLEPIERQAAVLEKWMDIKALKEMLDDLPGGEARAKAMFEAYVSGDENAILKISDEERTDFVKHGRTEKEYEEQMQDMLYSRNASWIPTIEKINAEGPAFVAVGALHLVGQKSVLDLLQQKGYKVTRITP